MPDQLAAAADTVRSPISSVAGYEELLPAVVLLDNVRSMYNVGRQQGTIARFKKAGDL